MIKGKKIPSPTMPATSSPKVQPVATPPTKPKANAPVKSEIRESKDTIANRDSSPPRQYRADRRPNQQSVRSVSSIERNMSEII